MGSRPTQVQMETLVDFLETNPDIAKGLLRTQQGKQETKKKWNELATTINALGGVVKDGPGWAKYWAEKKCALKKLCAQHSQSIRRTGGGTQALPSLSPLELRLVAVMGGETFATGDSQVAVNPFPQNTQSQPTQLVLQDLATSQASTSQMADTPVLNVDSGEETQTQAVSHAPPIATHHTRRGRPHGRRLQSQLNIEVDRFQQIEERRVEAEVQTAQALANASAALDRCANAIREGAQLIADALLQIAQRMPPPPAE